MLAFVSGAVQSERGDSDRAIRTQFYSLFEECAKTLRISIRGEPHDFVFVGVEIEAEMKRNQRIENPDGILGRYFVELCVSPMPSKTMTRHSSQPEVK